MNEFISAEEYKSEVSGMTREISALKRELVEKDKLLEEANKALSEKYYADPENPFDNPADYKGYSGGYTEIQPRLKEAGYRIPLLIDRVEYRNLKRQYSIGGWCVIFQFAASLVLSVLLTNVVQIIMDAVNGKAGTDTYEYMYNSSIIVGINMLVFLISNVVFTFVGLKWAGYKARSLIKTRDFTFGRGVQYCLIAAFLWTASVYCGTFVEMIMNKFGMTCAVDQTGLGETPLAMAVMYLYSCIIAPVTEEMMFRGMLLKVFSRANQRFAIFATAFFFGLAHGNIPQFILAFVMGIFLAQVTMKHNSIIPAIVVHIFVNVFSTVFSHFSDAGETVATVVMLLLMATALIGVIMLLVFRSDGNRLPAPTPHQHRRGRLVATSSMTFCIAVTIQIIYMIYTIYSLNR